MHVQKCNCAHVDTYRLNMPYGGCGVCVLNKICLSNQMTNRVQGSPLVHSRLINTLLFGLFSSKELSSGCSSTLDQCYEQCRQTAAKQTGPCLEGPPLYRLPQGWIVRLMEVSAGAPNHQTGPQGFNLLRSSISLCHPPICAFVCDHQHPY